MGINGHSDGFWCPFPGTDKNWKKVVLGIESSCSSYVRIWTEAMRLWQDVHLYPVFPFYPLPVSLIHAEYLFTVK